VPGALAEREPGAARIRNNALMPAAITEAGTWNAPAGHDRDKYGSGMLAPPLFAAALAYVLRAGTRSAL
jgi:hypothetical protein